MTDRAQSIAIDPRWQGRGIEIDLRPEPTDATSGWRRRKPIPFGRVRPDCPRREKNTDDPLSFSGYRLPPGATG